MKRIKAKKVHRQVDDPPMEQEELTCECCGKVYTPPAHKEDDGKNNYIEGYCPFCQPF